MNSLANLNKPQLEAVTTFGMPILILAGAGSGKTRTITHKIGYMIEEKSIKPSNILAMTFTNKAASEMKERVFKILATQLTGLWIGTFHSVCLKILRKNVNYLDFLSDFVIYDDNDQVSLIKSIIKEDNLSDKVFTPRSLQHYVNMEKNNGNTPDNATSAHLYPREYLEIFKRYQSKLKKLKAVDFCDILLLTSQLFEKNNKILEYYRDKFKYILIDEYQDTNRVQYNLLKQLSEGKKDICVVGDDDQSIYKWRGADIRNILSFKKDFPDSRIIKLEQNYRSTKTILATSQHIISKNRNRMDKRLWTDNPDGNRIKLFFAQDDLDEARFVSRRIKALEKDGTKLSNIAVFYRTNAQSRVFEEEFLRLNIPHIVVGSYRFFERKEIRDIIAFLNFVVNPYDIIALKRIIQSISCGIGNKMVERIEEITSRDGVDSLTALARLSQETKGQRSSNVNKLYNQLSGYKENLNKLSSAKLIEYIVKSSCIMDTYKEDNESPRIENIIEFVNSSYQYFNNNPSHKIRDFLDRISLVSDTDKIGTKANAVTIMTLHLAKGLEFDFVFISGFEENLLPHKRSYESQEAIEEERRLCYVGFTRAKKELFLSCASRRMFFGRFERAHPSRFMDAIPEAFIERHFSESLY